AGNIKLMDEFKIPFNGNFLDELTLQGKTPVFFSDSNKIIAVAAIADQLKENSKDAVEKLHKLGIKILMLSGDNKNTAEYIGKQAGIDGVYAEVLPQDKAKKIRELQGMGAKVAMAGDGINDAPALAQSDVGIAMGTGTDVAIESSDITLLKGDISKIPQAIILSRKTMRTIRQNLFWAFIYNIIGIPLAAGLFYPIWGILLNPVFAGLAMAFSSVSVVSNSLRLKFTRL
ncbi:MAG: HAD-IC family P-type ATPase, partial [Actinobacteria bacterium]|nr:HAD-IC family P-type ATPase [Actinomycetota bacterium]